MADESVTTTTETTEQQANPFGNESWTEKLPEIKPTTEGDGSTTTTETKETTTTVTEPVIEVPKAWLKKEFDIEDPTILKTEREELKKLRDAKPVTEEIKWENEQSKHLHELYRTGKWKEANSIIEQQEQIESLASVEVNKDTASDIIKLNMKLKYPGLKKDQIDFQYKQDYGIPREPVIKDTEDESDFNERHEAWKELVSNIEMKRDIAATMAKPELIAAKVKLVLPEIDKPTAQANEPTAEQLDLQKKAAENFLAHLESNYSKAAGFQTKVKDESVKLEFPVEFKIPDEEKVAIKTRLQKGLDVSDYMDKRWFDENNQPKIEQIITDLYQLENLDKILSGVANDSATERLKEHRKLTSNVHVTGNGLTQTFEPNQNGGNSVDPFAKNSWSEKPPTITNN